ncbi:NGG1p interacting factor NIF3 [Marinobacterium sp. AK62]|uniref:NGG1p interacting factor NIF3 n=1 Tax=Marinobacterium alkalitolerans TaxID=1542925 RepID=A0ABS3Z969_9GAMM|nr:YqfO family protein [Marinobacterium alkalitolerans]MBP0048234.1 NGG1p interacting factor NIF3 [Marinobacterium alkalitolerans]
MYKLCFFVPETDAEPVKTALFEAGVGRIGDYDQCCWQTLGTGQFRPLDGANPHLGQQGQLETVPELKVEMVCTDELIKTAVATLKEAHPYEEVAYEVYKLAEF